MKEELPWKGKGTSRLSALLQSRCRIIYNFPCKCLVLSCHFPTDWAPVNGTSQRMKRTTLPSWTASGLEQEHLPCKVSWEDRHKAALGAVWFFLSWLYIHLSLSVTLVCYPVGGKDVPIGTPGSTKTARLWSFDCRLVVIVEMAGFSWGTYIFCCNNCLGNVKLTIALVLCRVELFDVAFGYWRCFNSALHAVLMQFKPATVGFFRLMHEVAAGQVLQFGLYLEV